MKTVTILFCLLIAGCGTPVIIPKFPTPPAELMKPAPDLTEIKAKDTL